MYFIVRWPFSDLLLGLAVYIYRFSLILEIGCQIYSWRDNDFCSLDSTDNVMMKPSGFQ